MHNQPDVLLKHKIQIWKQSYKLYIFLIINYLYIIWFNLIIKSICR